MATTAFLFVLSHLYKEYWWVFILLSILDLASHWYAMYSSLIEKRTSHKGESKSGLFLVNFYYSHYWFFAYCCVGAEVLYLALYLLTVPKYQHWPALPIDGAFMVPVLGAAATGPLSLASVVALLCLPGCLTKQIVNVFQLLSSAAVIAEYDRKQMKNN